MDAAKKAQNKEENLCSIVDRNFEENPKKFMGWVPFLKKNGISLSITVFFMSSIIIFLYLLETLTRAIVLSLNQLNAASAISLYLALTVGLIALLNLSINIINMIKPAEIHVNVVTYNFEKMKLDVKENELPLLKALIIMKSKHPEFSLNTLLCEAKHALTTDKIIEILYVSKE